jgi:hypothetical protein
VLKGTACTRAKNNLLDRPADGSLRARESRRSLNPPKPAAIFERSETELFHCGFDLSDWGLEVPILNKRGLCA